MVTDGASRPKKTRGFGLRDPQWQWTYAAVASFGLGHVLGPRRRKRPHAGAVVHAPQAAAFAGAFVGCLTTLFFSEFGMAAGVASALATTLLCGLLLVTRTASLLPGEFFVALYGGTFAGMTPVASPGDGTSDPSAVWLIVQFAALSLVCGIAFWIMAEIDVRSGRKLARGYGGRAGAIAAVASFLFVQLAPLFGADEGVFHAVRSEMPDLMSALLTCVACASGMVVTMLVLRRPSFAPVNAADRTFVAAALALIGLIALHMSNPTDISTPDAFYAGCFLGMSTPKRLNGWYQPLLAAIVLTAMLALARTFLPGVGGSLGFAAFVTVTLLVLLDRITIAATAKIPVRAIAIPVAVVVAIGCLVLPGRYTPEEPAPDTTASAQAAGDAMPAPAQLVLIEARPAASDDAIAPAMPAVKVDNADLTGNLEASHAAQAVDGKARAAAEPPTQATSEVTAPAASEPARSESPVGDAMETHEKMLREFREFLEWRAARSAGLAQAAPPPVRRSRAGTSPIIGLLAHAVPTPQPRPARLDHPVSSPAAPRQVARRAVHNTAATPAPDRLLP